MPSAKDAIVNPPGLWTIRTNVCDSLNGNAISTLICFSGITISSVHFPPASRDASALYGTSRARIANMVQGVHAGFTKVLDVVGLGFKANITGDKLVLNIGHSHPTEFIVPKDVKVTVDPKSTQITIFGASKESVGAVAAEIRSLKPPEPYKGTGIRYFGEHIVRKAGKTAAGASAGSGGGAKK